MLQNFSLDRPSLLKNNIPERIIQLLQNEAVEAAESLTDTENLPGEIADILIFALTLANHYGFDMELEVREKISLNIIRYQAKFFQEGDYEEARKYVKSIEKPILEEFYQIPR